MDVAIIGYGWVGRAMGKLFPDAIIYDPEYSQSATKEAANSADVAFICVPTPNMPIGSLDTSIVHI